MQMAFLENPHEARAFALAVGVIAFSILAFASFIALGGGLLFYIFVAAVLVAGLYMAYHLSTAPPARAEAPRAPIKPAKSAKRRARKR